MVWFCEANCSKEATTAVEMEEGRGLQSVDGETQMPVDYEENESKPTKTTEMDTMLKQELDTMLKQELKSTVEEFRLEMDSRDAKLREDMKLMKEELISVIETKFKEMKTGQDLSSPIIPPANVFGGGVPHWTIVKFVKKNRGKSPKHVVILVPQIDPQYYRHKWE